MAQTAFQKIASDVRWLYRHAAVIGLVLALICHMLPPDYRVVCDQLRSACGLAKD